MAGFLTLVFNPQAWAVVAMTAVLCFSGGVVKGWSWSAADQLRDHVEALEKASDKKEELAAADQQRAQKAEADLDETNKALDAMLVRFKDNSCKLSGAELSSLHELAASGSRH